MNNTFVIGEKVILHNFNSILYDGKKAIITGNFALRDVVFANEQDVVWRMWCYTLDLLGVNNNLVICAESEQLLKYFPSVVNRECDRKVKWNECVWFPKEMY